MTCELHGPGHEGKSARAASRTFHPRAVLARASGSPSRAGAATGASAMLSLWLDLRGKPVANDLTALLDLYGGVRKRFDKAGQPPPQGSAVTGVLHLLRDLEKDEEDGEKRTHLGWRGCARGGLIPSAQRSTSDAI